MKATALAVAPTGKASTYAAAMFTIRHAWRKCEPCLPEIGQKCVLNDIAAGNVPPIKNRLMVGRVHVLAMMLVGTAADMAIENARCDSSGCSDNRPWEK
jgi:hypothetical protein